MSTATDMGLVDNWDGTFSDPSTPGVLYDENGNTTGGSGMIAPSDNSGMVMPYMGVGSSPASGGTETPPAGATGTDSTGTKWVDVAGNILGDVIKSAVTPYLNNIASGGLLQKGTDMLVNAGSAANNVNVPDLTRLIPQLKLQVMQGSMTPAQAAAAVQEATNMGAVRTDQGSLQGQRAALAQLANIGQNGGMTEADRAALNATMDQTNANAAQQRAAQIQQLQMQGNAGTGAELAARLSGIQGTANSNAMAGAQTAQAAQARALQAIQAGLQGNAALNTQQFSQEAQKAQAADAVNQFNAQARQAANLSNAGMAQQAGMANFNTANQIAGTNTTIQNQQAMMPYQAAQANYTNAADNAKTRGALGVAAGTPLVKAATDQITRSTNAAGAAPAAGTGVPAAGQTVDPITGAITKGITSAIGSGVGDLIGGGLSKVADWLGFADGGYVNIPKPNAVSDEDIDHLIAHMTAYKYRRKV